MSHQHRLRSLKNRYVPVPIGSTGIPRRDREHLKEKYCRLMLIFVQTLEACIGLKKQGNRMVDSLCEFTKNCPTHHIRNMDNMQILHECRDSRDDHFSAMASARRANAVVNTNITGSRSTTEDDFYGGR